jgi:hypothetical protein
MSNFRESVVPPPMCGYSLTLPSFVTSVVFASKFDVNQSSNDVCVVMNNAIAIFSQNSGKFVHYYFNLSHIEFCGVNLDLSLKIFSFHSVIHCCDLSPLTSYKLK